MSNRKSNLELLRIISMILIIGHHFIVHGFVLNNLENHSLYLLGPGAFIGGIGVNCFVLISGYFLNDSNFKIYKIFKIAMVVLTYSIGISLFFHFFIPDYVSSSLTCISELFPIGRGKYWFVTSYVVLICLSPGLNMILSRLSQRKLMYVIWVEVFFWSVMDTFIQAGYGYNSILLFIMLYTISSYIKKYVDINITNGKKHLTIGILSCGIIMFTGWFFVFLTQVSGNNFFRFYCRIFSSHNSIFVIVASVEMFIFFIKMPIKNYAWINRIAATTLGVYLIHDNIMVRQILWKDWLKTESYSNSDYLILYMIFSVAVVFVICSCIDLIRQMTIGKFLDYLLNRYYGRGKIIFQKLFDISETKAKKIINWYY